MKNNTLQIGLTLFLAILIVAVGFATINSVTLTISGTGSATAADANFLVALDSTVTPTVSSSPSALASSQTASITNGTTAVLNVSGLTTRGDYVEATYTIKNSSPDLSALLGATVTQATNTEYFNVSYALTKAEIAAGESTTIKVRVELLKTPAADQTTAGGSSVAGAGTFKVEITANPEAGTAVNSVTNSTVAGNTVK